MELKIGEHWVGHIGTLQVHWDTLITMWIAMGILIVLSLVVTRKLSIIPSKIQSVAESIMSFFWGLVEPMGREGKKHVPLLATLFLFILTANLIGQIPWRLYHLHEGELASPTNDLNMTAAMAIIVLIYYIGAGVLKKGPGYFKHYLKPFVAMTPFNILEDIIRPFSLAVRLFANILAGEVLIMVFIGMAAVLVPLPFMLFELFVALIQALVFTLLSAAYLSIAIEDNH